MKLQTIITSVALGLGIAALSGCATTQGPNTFTRSEAGRTQTVEAGTVTAVRPVTIQTDGTAVGTATVERRKVTCQDAVIERAAIRTAAVPT